MKQRVYFLAALLFLTACGRKETTTYQIPKEPSAAPAPTQSMGSAADTEAVQAAHASMTAQAPAGPGYTSELPEGWTEKAGSGMRKVSYAIEGTTIDFYLISLSMGDVPSNVNRWRGQVGLPPASPEEIAKEVATFQVSGQGVKYIEIYNEEDGKGIIAAIVDLSPNYWYFTAKGSDDELKTTAADIRKFLESIKIK